jgi:oligopeptide transport system substrate-binding protein
VAQNWEVLEGGAKYVFHMRGDVRWSDGVAVTAGDFEYAWKRLLDMETTSHNPSLLYDVKNAKAFHQRQEMDPARVGVRAIDPQTLVVELEGPTGYFLDLMACTVAFPVPRHVVEARGGTWTEPGYIVTNGPFLLQAAPAGEVLMLQRNPGYHGPTGGNVRRVEYHVLPSAAWRLAAEMYEAERLDVVYCGRGLEPDQFRLRHPAEDRFQPALETHFLAFVTSRPPCDDVRVRRALAMAIDRQQLPGIEQGGASPATGGFVPPGMPGHSPGIAPPFDAQGARRLLAEAGLRPGDLALAGLGLPGGEVSAYLQEQWRRNLGIDTRWQHPQPYYEAIDERLQMSGLHMFEFTWAADYPDPDDFLRVLMRGGAAIGWGNEAYGRLVEDARRCSDQGRRMRLYREADQMLVGDAEIVPLTYGRQHCLVKPWVKLQWSPLGTSLYADAIIEPH